MEQWANDVLKMHDLERAFNRMDKAGDALSNHLGGGSITDLVKMAADHKLDDNLAIVREFRAAYTEFILQMDEMGAERNDVLEALDKV